MDDIKLPLIQLHKDDYTEIEEAMEIVSII